MDLSTLRPGDTLYMVHYSGNKFWEITVLDRSNHIRYGKLNNGEEDEVVAGQRLFSSQSEALGRAKQLAETKIGGGYHLLTQADRKESPKDEQQGEFAKAVMQGKGGTYMELCEEGFTSYWKVHVTGMCYLGSQVRVEKGIAGGRPAVWVNTYVDEDEAAKAGKAEVRDKLARGFKRAEEKLPAVSPLSRDVIEIDLSSPAPTPPLSPLRTSPCPSTDLQQVFSGSGLERYIPALEAENVPPTQVSIDDLCLLTEDDFLRLGIPPFPASKLKAYISTQSTASPTISKRKREDSDLPPTDQKRPKVTPKPTDPDPASSIDIISPQPWDDSINPRNWLITAAIDGVRCLWTGSELLSKSGQPLPAPSFFTDPLPHDVQIVGELYIPGEPAKKCLSQAKRLEAEAWKDMKLSCFDLPALRRPLEERVCQLQMIVKAVNLPFVTTPAYAVCSDVEQMRSELARSSETNPSGLLLRQPGSYYDPKRSKSLLKVKKPLESTAIVTGYDPGKGKYEGLIGGLRVQTEDGKEFKLTSGLSDSDRKVPPLVGARVRFQYQESSAGGTPKYPVFVREQEDSA